MRERGADIVSLAQTLAGVIAARYGLAVTLIPPVGQQRIQTYTWPGNVRELAHEIERSLVFEDDQLSFSGLVSRRGMQGEDDAKGAWLRQGFKFPEDGGFDLEQAIDHLVERALVQADDNVSGAARLLGVPRDYVRYRLKRKSGAE